MCSRAIEACAIHLLQYYNVCVQVSPLSISTEPFDGLFAADGKHSLTDNFIIFDPSNKQSICTYVGEIITSDQFNERYSNPIDGRSEYVMQFYKSTFIDAFYKRGMASCINHAVGNKTNVYAYYFDGAMHIKPKRIIYAGEELLLNYGVDYNIRNTVIQYPLTPPLPILSRISLTTKILIYIRGKIYEPPSDESPSDISTATRSSSPTELTVVSPIIPTCVLPATFYKY